MTRIEARANIAANIKRLRCAAGLSRHDLATLLDDAGPAWRIRAAEIIKTIDEVAK